MSVLSTSFQTRHGTKYIPTVNGVNGLKMTRNTDRDKPLNELYVSAFDFEYAVSEVIALRKHLNYLSSIFNQDISEKIDADINERLITLKGE